MFLSKSTSWVWRHMTYPALGGQRKENNNKNIQFTWKHSLLKMGFFIPWVITLKFREFAAWSRVLTLLLCFGNLILLFSGQVIFSRVKRFSLLRMGSEFCARVSWIYFRWLWFCQQYYRFLITFVLYLEHPLHQRKYFPSFTIGRRRFQKLEERDWGVDPEVSLWGTATLAADGFPLDRLVLFTPWRLLHSRVELRYSPPSPRPFWFPLVSFGAPPEWFCIATGQGQEQRKESS